MIRSDLLSLDEEDLIRLANRGLVKRAKKILASGPQYQVTCEPNGELQVKFDDANVRIPPQTQLSQSHCSCPSSSICRHRILAILCYQKEKGQKSGDKAWNPGDVPDENFSKAKLRAARKAAKAGLQVKLEYGAKPVAKLPTCRVVFLVPQEPSHASCDCAQSPDCHHVALAVLAFRQAAGQSEVRLGESEHPSISFPKELYRELYKHGVVHASPDLDELFNQEAKRLEREGAAWMSDLGYELAKAIGDYSQRRAAYRAEDFSELLLEFGVRSSSNDSRVLGCGPRVESEMGYKEMLCLGQELQYEDQGTELKIYWADLDNQVVLVQKKTWKNLVSIETLRERKLLSQERFKNLTGCLLRTKTAKRQANRSVELKNSRVNPSQLKPFSQSWDRVLDGPLLQENFSQLAETLSKREVRLRRSRVLADELFVLKVENCVNLFYDPAEQEVCALLLDPQGHEIRLVAEHNPANPNHLFGVFRQCQEDLDLVCGFVRATEGGLTVRPLSLLGQSIFCCGLAEGEPLSMKPGHWQKADGVTLRLLDDCISHLARGAHQGLGHLNRDWRSRTSELAKELERIGFRESAQSLSKLKLDSDLERSIENWLSASLRLYLLRHRATHSASALCSSNR